MNSLRRMFSSATTRVETLRTVVSRIKYSKTIDELPDSLARVLEAYDRAPLHANFRTDIQTILSGSVEVAEAMLDPAFDSNQAIATVSAQITTLSRVLNYLAQRPTRIGYSILSVSSGTLLGNYSSEGEARQHLADLQSLGHAASNAIVVPVKITSQFSIRPAPTDPNSLPSFLSPTDPATPTSPNTIPTELSDMQYTREQHDSPAPAAWAPNELEAPANVKPSSTFIPPKPTT